MTVDDLLLLIDASIYLGERRAWSGTDVVCGYCGEWCREGEKITHSPNCGVGVALRLRQSSAFDDPTKPVVFESTVRRTEAALAERCASAVCPGLANCLACPEDASASEDDEISPEHAREMSDWIHGK